MAFHLSFRQATDQALTNPVPGAAVPSQRETVPFALSSHSLRGLKTPLFGEFALRPKRLTLRPYVVPRAAAAADPGPGMLAQPGGGMVRTPPYACVFCCARVSGTAFGLRFLLRSCLRHRLSAALVSQAPPLACVCCCARVSHTTVLLSLR